MPAKTSRAAGCFMVVFFGMFAVVPALGFFGIFFGDANVSDDFALVVGMLTVFFLIGVAGLYFGFRMLLGIQKTSAATTKDPALPGAALPPAAAMAPMANGYYRLKPESSQAATFVTLMVVALFWNGLTLPFLIGTISGTLDDPPPLWFMLIFVAVGLILLGIAIKSFFRWTMVGETHVDVNTSTATPGQIIELLVSQPGRFTIDRLTVDFICREKASYRAGTDTRTKTEVVREAAVCDHSSLNAREGQVLTHQSALVPADAMLSFKASNNEIAWLVRVKMILPGRPDVEQFYPIRIVSPEILRRESGRG